MNEKPILKLTDGLLVVSGPVTYAVPPVRLTPGQWVTFVPEGADPATDPAGTLARCLVSLSAPAKGTVEIFERDAYGVSYRAVQRLRSSLGFVQGFGGLLSNRSIRGNVALPINVHAKMDLEEEKQHVDRIIEGFNLKAVEHERPHVVDGFTRWRTCLARALVLKPAYVVLEGIGDWGMDAGQGIAWRQLVSYNKRGNNVICICASRRNQGFETWFKEKGGVVVEYKERNSS